MSEKELMYLDDTLSHLEQTDEFCNSYVDEIEDEDLKKVINDVIKKNREIHQKFLNLL